MHLWRTIGNEVTWCASCPRSAAIHHAVTAEWQRITKDPPLKATAIRSAPGPRGGFGRESAHQVSIAPKRTYAVCPLRLALQEGGSRSLLAESCTRGSSSPTACAASSSRSVRRAPLIKNSGALRFLRHPIPDRPTAQASYSRPTAPVTPYLCTLLSNWASTIPLPTTETPLLADGRPTAQNIISARRYHTYELDHPEGTSLELAGQAPSAGRSRPARRPTWCTQGKRSTGPAEI
ncbi:hypothetical protein SSPIM334S_03997 [Streptomyces spiroverticillatus]